MKKIFRLTSFGITVLCLIYLGSCRQADDTYNRANSYYVQGNYRLALESYEELISKNPAYALQGSFLKALCLKQLDLIPQAEQVLNQIITKYSDHPVTDQALFLLGQLEMMQAGRKGNLRAEQLFKEHLEKYPSSLLNSEVNVSLGNVYMNLGEWEKATEIFKSMLEKSKLSSEIRQANFFLGVIYSHPNNSQKEIPLATSHLEAALKVSPEPREKALIYFMLGECYRQIKEWSKAITFYKYAVEARPDTFLAVSAQTMLGICYKEHKDLQMSRKAFDNVLKSYAIEQRPLATRIQKQINYLDTKPLKEFTISANSIQYNKAGQKASYHGNVKLYNDRLDLSSDELTIDLGSKKIQAQGKTSLKGSPGWWIEAPFINFEVPEAKISADDGTFFTGGEGAEPIKARKILLDLNSGQIQANGQVFKIARWLSSEDSLSISKESAKTSIPVPKLVPTQKPPLKTFSRDFKDAKDIGDHDK